MHLDRHIVSRRSYLQRENHIICNRGAILRATRSVVISDLATNLHAQLDEEAGKKRSWTSPRGFTE